MKQLTREDRKELRLLGERLYEDRIKALYNAGYSIVEIAKKLEIGESVVEHIIEKHNLKG